MSHYFPEFEVILKVNGNNLLHLIDNYLTLNDGSDESLTLFKYWINQNDHNQYQVDFGQYYKLSYDDHLIRFTVHTNKLEEFIQYVTNISNRINFKVMCHVLTDDYQIYLYAINPEGGYVKESWRYENIPSDLLNMFSLEPRYDY